MANKQLWQDDYWLLMMQAYLQKPVGIKPTYCREMVNLSLELHIAPEVLHERLGDIARLRTPRIERLWKEYSENPRRLKRAVSLLRQMKGFGAATDFYDGVEVQETFEKDFRPLAEDSRFTPVMLVMILSLYFQLTPQTMVSETPEVQQLARLLKLKPDDVTAVLTVFQRFDPYLNRRDNGTPQPLLEPCRLIWQRYGSMEPEQLAAHAEELKAYFI